MSNNNEGAPIGRPEPRRQELYGIGYIQAIERLAACIGYYRETEDAVSLGCWRRPGGEFVAFPPNFFADYEAARTLMAYAWAANRWREFFNELVRVLIRDLRRMPEQYDYMMATPRQIADAACAVFLQARVIDHEDRATDAKIA